MNKLKKLEAMRELLPKLRNYTSTLLTFLVLDSNDNDVPKRYTQKKLIEITGLSSASLQLGIHELENNNLLVLVYVGKKGNYKHSPEFNLKL